MRAAVECKMPAPRSIGEATVYEDTFPGLGLRPLVESEVRFVGGTGLRGAPDCPAPRIGLVVRIDVPRAVGVLPRFCSGVRGLGALSGLISDDLVRPCAPEVRRGEPEGLAALCPICPLGGRGDCRTGRPAGRDERPDPPFDGRGAGGREAGMASFSQPNLNGTLLATPGHHSAHEFTTRPERHRSRSQLRRDNEKVLVLPGISR